MSTLDEILTAKFRNPPPVGVPADEFMSVVRLVAESTEIHDKRIMSVLVLANGMVLVKTGEWPGPCAGGGCYVLVSKNGDTWRVVEISGWH
jgi:hypothetical protein